MRRRRFLAGSVAVGAVAVAGCLGSGDDGDTVLDITDREEASEDPSFPVNGEELPSVEVPSPLHDSTIETDAFVGERETLLTFVFSRCPGPCHTLASTLAHVQAAAIDDGVAEEVALLPVTFDPETDTADVLADFYEANGADPHAANWHALRPETPADAETVVQDTFGVWYEEVPWDESGHGDHNGDHDGEMTFDHANLVVLANRDGYVERSYFGATGEDEDDFAAEITPPRVLDDWRTVHDEFA